MDANYEAFLLFYTAFHKFEITLKEFKEMLVSEIGEDGLKAALVIFKEKIAERAGQKGTLHDSMK